ncbi:phage tail tube protein [Zhihengliuella halotolerans]|uniref:Phage tail tube protein n=1 Tax=Zhihengliuella halotolerans TaxID=370736 RepID=A0A4Q8ABB7_9MICC|nr:phage tail tube protein [Zhihengliuella halotolerans]RZU61447.1 phage tail tube protein [Zhihengliuella halotolerans]
MAINTTVVGNGLLTIGAVGSEKIFASQVTECTLEPEHEAGDTRYVLSGESKSGNLVTTWTLSGNLLSDLGQTESLQEWLFDENGNEHPFEFSPNNTTGKKVVGVLQVRAVAFGGEANAEAEAEFEFPVTGTPAIESIV